MQSSKGKGGKKHEPVLIAITTASQCGVTLPYGPSHDWDGESPYFCLDCVDIGSTNYRWKQIFFDEDQELFTMTYSFQNGSKTLRDRFNDAAQSGEPVEWTIQEAGKEDTTTIIGDWWWTTDSILNGRTYPNDEAGASGFSLEQSCWGAGSPHVSGGFDVFPFELERDIQFGQCEIEAGCCGATSILPEASGCGNLWMNGVKLDVPNLKSMLYVLE